jgi:hypothetical protein
MDGNSFFTFPHDADSVLRPGAHLVQLLFGKVVLYI